MVISSARSSSHSGMVPSTIYATTPNRPFRQPNKRKDLRYLRYMFRLLTARRTKQLHALQAQLRDFENNAYPTATPPERLTAIREQIKALQK